MNEREEVIRILGKVTSPTQVLSASDQYREPSPFSLRRPISNLTL